MIRLLARFKIAHKLLISSAVFALPIAILLYFVVSSFNEGIDMAQREMEGTRRLEPLRRLSEEVRMHERLTYYRLKGEARWEARRTQSAERIEAALAGFRQVAGKTETEPAARLAADWKRLREQPPAAPEANAKAHQQITAALRALMREVGDASKLVLDPELDSYYLMTLAVALLPQAQEIVADSGMLASQVALEEQLSQRDLMRFAVYAETLENSVLPQVRHAVETSLKENQAGGSGTASLQQNLPPLLARYQAEISAYAGAMQRYSQMLDSNLTPAEVAALGTRAGEAGSAFWQTSAEELRVQMAERISNHRWKRAAALLMGLLAVALAGLVVALVAQNISRPLSQVVLLASEIAQGQVKEARARLGVGAVREMLALSRSGVDVSDEMCALVGAIAHMTDSLDSLLAQVGRAGSQVAGSAAHIVTAVRQLEATVAEQAASANEVSATSREIFATVQELARTMSAVSRAATDATDSATAGVSSLERIHAAMQALLEAGEGLSATLTTISDKARNVDEVISAITKVANRTNLLSLNAAIEAEKAGESAGGFSVVAVEIRRLADQTAVAALDIERLVQQMQSAVREGVASVEQYAEQTRTSSGAVDALSAGLGRVIHNTQNLAPQFETVNQGMQSQSQGAGQIAESMTQLRDTANQTRDALGEFGRVAEQLRAAVDGLQAEVGRFSTAGG